MADRLRQATSPYLLQHAGNPVDWWPGLVGDGHLIDPERFFIVCVNMPGSCYGSLGPLSDNPITGQPYFHSFPFFTPRDMIRSYQQLKDFLGIRKIKIGIGGSMGGQQLLEWANIADYMRIPGMGKAKVGLVRAAGVTTVRELALRNPARLAQNMKDVNTRRKLVRVLPSERSVEQLIERARKLAPKISY
jgi:hypothetical protein